MYWLIIITINQNRKLNKKYITELTKNKFETGNCALLLIGLGNHLLQSPPGSQDYESFCSCVLWKKKLSEVCHLNNIKRNNIQGIGCFATSTDKLRSCILNNRVKLDN